MIRKIAVFLLICFLFCQCQAPDVKQLGTRTFFDLKAFIQQEKEKIYNNQTVFEKTVIFNGQKETKLIAKPKLDVEFSEFISSDINRVAWLDKYEETTDQDGIHYTATDDKLEVRKMDIIDHKDGKKITIKKRTHNLLNDTQKDLEYHSDLGYHIKSVRKSIGESADTLEIFVNFQ